MYLKTILFALVGAATTLALAAPAPAPQYGGGRSDISLDASENLDRDRFSRTRFDSHTHDKSFENVNSDRLDASRNVDLDINRDRDRHWLKERSGGDDGWFDGWKDFGDGKHDHDIKHDFERHHEDEKHHWTARQEQGRRPEPPRPGPPPPGSYPPHPYPPPYYPPPHGYPPRPYPPPYYPPPYYPPPYYPPRPRPY